MISKNELADLYGISKPTLNRYLKKLELYDPNQRYISPYQLRKIFEKLGDPKILEAFDVEK